jgi:hypothetical protein
MAPGGTMALGAHADSSGGGVDAGSGPDAVEAGVNLSSKAGACLKKSL